MVNTFLNLWLLQVNSAVKVEAVVNLAKNVMKKSHSPWVEKHTYSSQELDTSPAI